MEVELRLGWIGFLGRRFKGVIWFCFRFVVRFRDVWDGKFFRFYGFRKLRYWSVGFLGKGGVFF